MDVINRLSGLTVNKETLIEQLERFTGDAGEFQSLREAIQASICDTCGITGWTDVILESAELW